MEDKDLLQAIEHMMDQMMDSKLEPISERLDGIDTRLDGIDTRLDRIDTRLDNVETGLHELSDRVSSVEITQEQLILPKLDLLAEGHALLLERIVKLEELPGKVDNLQTDVTVLKGALKEHIAMHSRSG